MEKIIRSNFAAFKPHFVFYECDDKCKETDEDKKQLSKYCVSNGKYCHNDPDGKGPLEGRDSVLQSLDELCVWKSIPE